MSSCARCCEAEDNVDKPRLPITGLSSPGFSDPNMDERDALDNCRCKLGPANAFGSRLVEMVELIPSSSSEASSSGFLAMRDSRFDVRVAPSSKSCAGSGGHQRDIRGSSVMAKPFRGPSEGHKRGHVRTCSAVCAFASGTDSQRFFSTSDATSRSFSSAAT